MGLYGFKDSKSRRTTKLHERFKSYSNFNTVFFKTLKNFKHRHVECLSRGNRLEYCGAHSDFILGECIWRKRIFQSLKTYKMGPIYLSDFGIQLQIWSPKMKSECTAQYFSLLPLDKHPTCLCLKFLTFWKKNGYKIVVTFEPIMQFCCPSRFRILKTL